MPHSQTDAPVTPGTADPGDRGLGRLYFLAGLVAFVASVALLIERIELLKNPDYTPTCSFNPVLSCGSVMTTPQAELFGFPNPILGVAGFAALSMLGAVMAGGARIEPWLRIATQIGIALATVFIHWLAFQSLYVIGALCPYCMVVWVMTLPLFVYTFIRPSANAGRMRSALVEYRGLILTVWYLLFVVLIAHRFASYWVSLF